MYRKIAVAGATAAAIVGVGTAALATSGSDSTTGNAKSGSTSAKQHHKNAARAALRRVVHGQLTTKGKDGYVTHTGIRGTVTSVSATSITVKAVDGYSQTFMIGKDTKIRERTAGNAKATAGKVSDLKSGDKVGVIGKGAEKSSAKPTATVVVDGVKK